MVVINDFAAIGILHRLHGVAHQIEHHLLDLYLVDEDQRRGRM